MLGLVACAAIADGEGENVEIVDGDTIRLDIQGPDEEGVQRQRIRLLGIDAPEARDYKHRKKEPFGEESTLHLKGLMSDEFTYRYEYDVQLRDKYGRLLAYIHRSDGMLINEEMVKAGMAKVLTIPPNVKYADRLVDAQKYAREHKLGIWE